MRASVRFWERDGVSDRTPGWKSIAFGPVDLRNYLLDLFQVQANASGADSFFARMSRAISAALRSKGRTPGFSLNYARDYRRGSKSMQRLAAGQIAHWCNASTRYFARGRVL